jgi:hypothetical protein
MRTVGEEECAAMRGAEWNRFVSACRIIMQAGPVHRRAAPMGAAVEVVPAFVQSLVDRDQELKHKRAKSDREKEQLQGCRRLKAGMGFVGLTAKQIRERTETASAQKATDLQGKAQP